MIVDTTLCGIPETVTDVAVDNITFENMTFRWNPPVNYNGNISNALYQVSFVCTYFQGLDIKPPLKINHEISTDSHICFLQG